MMADGYGKLKEEPKGKRSGDIVHENLPRRQRTRRRPCSTVQHVLASHSNLFRVL